MSSLARIGAVLAKEFIQMRRDRITFTMMLMVPIVELLLFGYAINMDPKGLPAALVSFSPDRFSRAISVSLENSGYFRFTHVVSNAAEAERLMASGEVNFVVTIPADLGRRAMRNEEPQILIEADASDPSAAGGAIATLGSIANKALARELGQEKFIADETKARLQIVVHRRYNPEGITAYNIVPGLLGVILQMTMSMMTAMALTREIERGTMENLLAMPASAGEIMVGKITPYFGVGAVQVGVILVTASLLFEVPFVGSFGLLCFVMTLFISGLVLLGYTISTLARTQMQAMQLTFFFFLPSMLLSGFMFPYRGMPQWAQTLGEIFPLTHFLRAIRAIMLKGATLGDLLHEIMALTILALIFAGLALARFRRTLD
jgi:ABC-2 type transport system permease protein